MRVTPLRPRLDWCLAGLLALSLACSGGRATTGGANAQSRNATPSAHGSPVLVSAHAVTASDVAAPSLKNRPEVVDLRKTLSYLASDDLEGRGVDTQGLVKAADYIGKTFDQLGLSPLPDGNRFQTFKITTKYSLGQGTTLASKTGAGDETTYDVRQQFIPVGEVTDDGEFAGPVAFVGYGIVNSDRGYDDYSGIDVKGKVALALRYEPHSPEGKSAWVTAEQAHRGQSDWSPSAPFIAKAKAAAARGAKALVVVNPPNFHPVDALVVFSRPVQGERSPIPVIQVKREVAEAWLKAGGAPSLAELQKQIDESGKPHSIDLGDKVRVSGKVDIEKTEREVRNVAGILPGKGPHKDEYVVVGAHYDHLGRGGVGSLAPGSHEIHNGADDNASGTTAMLKIAEDLARLGPQPRSILFLAFTAEEEGLIGSSYFVNHPPVPLNKITAMLNLDMVGRVKNDILYVGGGGTAASFQGMLDDVDSGSPLTFKSIGKGGLGPSDHMSFAMKHVPVIFLFSGLHTDYHRPTDDADKINYDGMKKVVAAAEQLAEGMAAMPREQYVAAPTDPHGGLGPIPQSGSDPSANSGIGSGAYLGSVPDPEAYGAESATAGVRLAGSVPGSPAEAAGIKEGDVLVKWNGEAVGSIYGMTDLLRRAKPGDRVKLGVMRDGKMVELNATLGTRKTKPD